MFARDNSGRSVLFSIKEESTRLAISSPFSKRHNGKEPPREITLLLLALEKDLGVLVLAFPHLKTARHLVVRERGG